MLFVTCLFFLMLVSRVQAAAGLLSVLPGVWRPIFFFLVEILPPRVCSPLAYSGQGLAQTLWRGFAQVGMPETSVQGFRGGDVPPTASARAAALSRDAEGDTE